MASSDFSWMALFLAGLVTLAQAYTQPTGNAPVGNSILTPGLNQIVPAGKPFDITWVPTTTGTVTLLLVHGPSNDVVPMYPIVEKLPNIGKYSWTPKTNIAPETTHYGIQLICDSNGQYQWSTQFGISNPSYSGSVSSSSSSSSVSIHSSATTSGTISASTSASGTETVNATTSSSVLHISTLPTLTGAHNTTSIHPTGTLNATTAKTTATAKHTTVLTSALPTTAGSTPTNTTSSVSTNSQAGAAMYTAAGGVAALAAAAVLVL